MRTSRLHGLLALFFAVGLLGAPARTCAEDLHPRTDRYGDPLPAGALARLGTVRWRPGEDIDLLAIAAEGKLVVAREPYGVFHIYDVATGREVRRLGHSRRAPDRGSFSPAVSILSPGGEFLVSVGGEKRSLHVWEVASGKERWRQHLGAARIQLTAVSADGRALAIWEDERRALVLRHTATGNVLGQVRLPAADRDGYPPAPADVAFARDGTILATALGDGTVRLWKVQTGQLVRSLGPAAGGQTRPVFSADGKTLTTVSTTLRGKQTLGAVNVWDVASGKEIRRIEGPKVGFVAAEPSPDGALMAWTGPDQVIRLQELSTARVRHRLPDTERGAARIRPVFSPNGEKLFVRHGWEECRLWDVQTGAVRWKRRNGFFSGPAAFSPDGKLMILHDMPGCGGLLRLVDAATGRELSRAGGHEGAVTSLQVSADGKTVTTLGTDQVVRRWDAATGRQWRQFPFPEAVVALFDDGRRAVVASTYQGRRQAALWDLEAGRPMGRVPTGRAVPIVLVSTPDGKTLAANSALPAFPLDYAFRLYDMPAGTERRLINEPRDLSLDRVAFSADGTLLATAWSNEGRPGAVYLSEVHSGRQLRRLQMPERIGVEELAFSPDGRTLALLYSSRAAPDTIVLWETATGKERGRLRGGEVAYDSAAVTFSPDGRTLAVAGADLTIRVWDVRSGRRLGQFAGHHGGIKCLAFCPDGRKLVSGSADTTALVWDVAPFCPPPLVVRLSPEQMEAHWAALAGSDAVKAFQAVSALSTAPRQTVAWFRARIRPQNGIAEKRLAELIADLDDGRFAVRTRAAEELERLGDFAQPALEKALANRPSLEQARRLERLLDRLKLDGDPDPDTIRTVRAVEVLEHIGTPEGHHLLQALAAGAPGARLTREARAALIRVRTITSAP